MSIANDVSISDELKRASMGFGEMITQVGAGIADTTRELTKTGTAAISALASTTVKVIAAEEIIYNDDGIITGHTAFSQQLPLINFVDPVIYQWTHVRIQGVFFARELSTATSDSYEQHRSHESSSQGGLFVIFGGGHNRFSYSGSYGTSQSQHDQDTSVGVMRLNALLEPRRDIGVPKPTQVTVGPSIAILQGPVVDVKTADVVIARTMEVVLEFRKSNGTPIAGKTLSIETPGLAWNYKTTAPTDTAGQVIIVLRRELPDPDADKSQAAFIVSARIGLVDSSVSLRL